MYYTGLKQEICNHSDTISQSGSSDSHLILKLLIGNKNNNNKSKVTPRANESIISKKWLFKNYRIE